LEGRAEKCECALGFSARDARRLVIMLDQHYERVMPVLFGDGNGNEGAIPRINKWLAGEPEREKYIKKDLLEEREKVHAALADFNGTQVIRIKDAVKEELEVGRRTTKADWKWLLAFLAAILSPYLLVYLEHTWK